MNDAGIQFGDTFVSRDEVMLRAARGATGLSSLGVGRDDTIAMMLRNDPAYLEATVAIRIVCALPVPINWHLRGEEVEYILKDSGAKAIIIHSDLYDDLKDYVPDTIQVIEVETPDILIESYGIDRDQCAIHAESINWYPWLAEHEPWTEEPVAQTASMIYTSGTTGRPKGVRREASTPEQYEQQIMVVAKVFGLTPGARTIIPAPLYHAAPNGYATFALQLEAFIVIMPRFDAEEFLRLIQEYRITRVQVVPTMFVRLLKLPKETREKYDLSSLEYIIHAAAPCPPQVKKDMIDWWGPLIWEYYGSTEMSAVTICSSEDAIRFPGTVGREIEEATVKILDENGQEVVPNEIGEVYGMLHTNSEFTYQNDDDKRREIDIDGLITCGDIGYMNEEGFLFLCDRASNMIISGGANIYPAEIESVLIEMDGVHDCAVFGIPCEDFGEKVAAIVEAEAGTELTAESVTTFLTERIAGFKLPRHIEFRDNLPREDSGKLFKRLLKEPFWKESGRSI